MARKTFAFLLLALALSVALGIGSQWLVANHGPSNVGPYVSNALVVLGPALAAMIMVRRSGRSVRQWFGEDWRQTRIVWLWAAVPLVALSVTATAFLLAGVSPEDVVAAVSAPGLILYFAFSIGIVGLLEELGWRGFLLREWLERATPLAAALIIAAAWGAWHLPKLMTNAAVAAALLAAIAVQSVLLTSLWSRWQGRSALTALAHGSFNAPILWIEQRVSPDVALAGFAYAIGIYAAGAGVLLALDWRWWVNRPKRIDADC